MFYAEEKYLELAEEILQSGTYRNIRGAYNYALFGRMLKYDISSVGKDEWMFPMCTYRKVGLKNIVEELIWMLRGDVDSSYLSCAGVPIWDGNTSKDFLGVRSLSDKVEPGLLGPMYGFQLRNFNAPYERFTREEHKKIREKKLGFDQIANLIKKLKTNPYTRTLLFTTFNPAQVDDGCLYPCTGIVVQFFVDSQKRLSSIMYQRSCDYLIGVPHNIAFYSLMTMLIAKIAGFETKEFTIFLGDAHIYEDHIPAYKKAEKKTYTQSSIKLLKEISTIEDIEQLKLEDFELINYQHGPFVKYNMFVM